MEPALVFSVFAPIVFTRAPAVALVTFTMTVHPPAGILVPFAMVKLFAPAVAVTPAQVPVLPAVLMVMPAGNVSVNKLDKVIAAAFALPIVIVRLVLPPATTSAAALDLVMVGGAGMTETQAPVVDVPPPAALLVTCATIFVSALKLAFVLVLLACGQLPSVGVGAVVMVQ